jgi:hypothetical protein
MFNKNLFFLALLLCVTLCNATTVTNQTCQDNTTVAVNTYDSGVLTTVVQEPCYYGCDLTTGACADPGAQLNFTFAGIIIIALIIGVILFVAFRINESIQTWLVLFALFMTYVLLIFVTTGYDNVLKISTISNALSSISQPYFWLIFMIASIFIIMTLLIKPLNHMLGRDKE